MSLKQKVRLAVKNMEVLTIENADIAIVSRKH